MSEFFWRCWGGAIGSAVRVWQSPGVSRVRRPWPCGWRWPGRRVWASVAGYDGFVGEWRCACHGLFGGDWSGMVSRAITARGSLAVVLGFGVALWAVVG